MKIKLVIIFSIIICLFINILLINNKEFEHILVEESFKEEAFYKRVEFSKLLNNNSILLLKESIPRKIVKKKEPLIYIYNTHPTEEYRATTVGEFSINPTVIMNDYLLEDILEKSGYQAYVEERLVSEILNNNNWNYASSYIASRMLIEDAKKKYPSIKYYIDIHRDSLDKSRTSINIFGKDYAKVLFIIGLENPNYNENLIFTEKINNKLNNYYPNLSKGIYKKEGPGVNGVYNQDFSPYVILIEVGGNENNTTEVLNTILAFSRCFLEVINEEDN